MFNIDTSWLVGGVVAFVTMIGTWFKIRSAKKEGITQGRNEVIKEVEKADESRAQKIRDRVDAIAPVASDDASSGVRSPKKPSAAKRKGRGYRD
jgi:hypothetical protein